MLSLWKEEIENWVCNLACIECSKGGCARAFPPKKKKKWKKNAFFLLCTFRKVIHDFCQMLFLGKKYRMYYEVTYYEKDTQLLYNTCHLPTTYLRIYVVCTQLFRRKTIKHIAYSNSILSHTILYQVNNNRQHNNSKLGCVVYFFVKIGM